MNPTIEKYSRKEQLANSLTHGLGLILSVSAALYLILHWGNQMDRWQFAALLIYGLSLIIMYLSSTLYHSIPGDHTRLILRKVDHSAIYLLIAGTYTPFLIITLRGTLGWVMFVIVWSIAIGGILYKIFRKIGPRWVSAASYVAMGWIAVLTAGKMIALLPCRSLYLLVAGGLIYTGGTVFYIWKKLPFNHAIWHLFVLGGSACHFFAVYYLL